jgi:hypothetical protein
LPVSFGINLTKVVGFCLERQAHGACSTSGEALRPGRK